MKKLIKRRSILALLIIMCLFTACNFLEEDTKRLEGPYDVVRVVDGDTIVIDYEDEEIKVRLIGIDTEESVHPDEKKNTEKGKLATEYTKGLVEGKEVELEFDEEKRDKYNRLLAYVYVDGEMLNKILVKDGYAKAKEYPPNTKYADTLKQLEEEAKATTKGLWEE